MKVIRDVIEDMDKTLEEANHYYKEYLRYKDDYPEVAATAISMAKTHLDLYNRWHDQVVNIINKYKSTEKEIPATMKELYDFQHEKLTEEFAELKYKINNV